MVVMTVIAEGIDAMIVTGKNCEAVESICLETRFYD